MGQTVLGVASEAYEAPTREMSVLEMPDPDATGEYDPGVLKALLAHEQAVCLTLELEL